MSHACMLGNGFDACVFCWLPFGGEDIPPERHVPYTGIAASKNYLYGPVIDPTTRTTYEYVGESDGGTPLAHIDCYKEWAEAIDTTNMTLAAFSNAARTNP